jgi:glycine/D-amino acid oxidase-like deaminating enzyme
MAPDIVIVGAGIVGAACAAECARAGLKVTVVDRGPVGGGTTGAGMGHIVVLDDSEAQFALSSYSRRLWRELAPELPPEAEFDSCGTMWIAADDDEMAGARLKADAFRNAGLRAELLDAPALAEAEPHLRTGLSGGLCIVDDAVLYPPAAARFLLDRAKTQNVDVRIGVDVRTLSADGGVLLADGTRISAGLAVNAAGCWSPALTPGLPVRKRKGHLVVTDRYPGFVRHQLVELGYLKSAHAVSADSVAFNIQPRKTGQMLIGSSRQFDADETDIQPDILRRMLGRAMDYLPGLNRLLALRVWTGFRPATPDKLPLIGPSPASDKIWLATGHEGLGITTALATGRLLADLVLGRTTEIPAAPYAPDRFLKGEEAHG